MVSSVPFHVKLYFEPDGNGVLFSIVQMPSTVGLAKYTVYVFHIFNHHLIKGGSIAWDIVKNIYHYYCYLIQ